MKDIFEKLMWNARLFIILAVILSLVGSILLFIVASVDILKVAKQTYLYYIGSLGADADIHHLLLNVIIMAVDLNDCLKLCTYVEGGFEDEPAEISISALTVTISAKSACFNAT